jgi:hypothetical protein
METLHIEFYECEHQGDLDNYIEDILESGGEVVTSEINYEAEIGFVRIEVLDKKDFVEKFSQTESYDFIN